MKHINVITKSAPKNAAFWQEVVCQIFSALAAILEAFGGSSPLLNYMNDKCDLPEQQ